MANDLILKPPPGSGTGTFIEAGDREFPENRLDGQILALPEQLHSGDSSRKNIINDHPKLAADIFQTVENVNKALQRSLHWFGGGAGQLNRAAQRAPKPNPSRDAVKQVQLSRAELSRVSEFRSYIKSFHGRPLSELDGNEAFAYMLKHFKNHHWNRIQKYFSFQEILKFLQYGEQNKHAFAEDMSRHLQNEGNPGLWPGGSVEPRSHYLRRLNVQRARTGPPQFTGPGAVTGGISYSILRIRGVEHERALAWAQVAGTATNVLVGVAGTRGRPSAANKGPGGGNRPVIYPPGGRPDIARVIEPSGHSNYSIVGQPPSNRGSFPPREIVPLGRPAGQGWKPVGKAWIEYVPGGYKAFQRWERVKK